MTDAAQPDYLARNQGFWDGRAASMAVEGRRAWAGEPTWGMWRIPESELRVFPDVAGKDVVELGCGTAYISAWLTRLGARVTGIDLSEAQLATARALQAEFALPFPLIHGNAEATPFPDGSFDLAVSEYGASIWCDPYRWIPEAARLLRPGGRLIFLKNHVLLMLCVPDEDNLPAENWLRRDYFGMHRFEWPDDPSVEFHLTHGDMLRLLRANGFEVENLLELQAPEGVTTHWQYVSPEWAHSWPSEEIWVARKAGP